MSRIVRARPNWAPCFGAVGLLVLLLCWISPIDALVPLIIGTTLLLAGAIGLSVRYSAPSERQDP